MCGIVVAIDRAPVEHFIRKVNTIQNHRGPDKQGTLFTKLNDVYLGIGHQRLSILDLSENGTQPMTSASGNTTITFNGEIYNYKELISDYNLRCDTSTTDTEVALELIEKIGIDKACALFNGMWALVVVDHLKNRAYLARDRMGKKPIYTKRDGSRILISSEVKSLLAMKDVNARVNPRVAARFLSQLLQNVNCESWLLDIDAFPPASIGEIDIASPELGIHNVRSYWTPSICTENYTEAEWISLLRETLIDATNIRLHADVPVGIALSGGLDSSILAALGQNSSGKAARDITCFSVVHPGHSDDESQFINIMQGQLSKPINRFTLDIKDTDALGLIQRCNYFNDGPISSFSTLLFFKLMEEAANAGITVALTGQGADEVFCGYRKYPILELKRRFKAKEFKYSARFLSEYLRQGTLLPEFNFAEAKRYLGFGNSTFLGEASLAALDKEPLGCTKTSTAERQLVDIQKYSVPYLCHYEDRMSMAWSREIRSPFLDYRIVELGLKMPTELKMKNGWNKYVLRKAFEDILPPEIAWRKDKKGFVNPEADWFRGPLLNVVKETMNDKSNPIYQEGLIDRTSYMKNLNAFINNDKRIWFRDVFAPFSLSLWMKSLTSDN